MEFKELVIMKHMLKKFFGIAALLSTAIAVADTSTSPYITIRSQSVDSARELVGWANDYHINLFDMCKLYGSFAVTPEYTRSFRASSIANALFGNDLQTSNGVTLNNNSALSCNSDCGRTIRISGSCATGRGEFDWLGDYFGLPIDYVGGFSVKPRISNFLVDFNLYLGLDEWMEGLYFRIHAPVVTTRWNLGYCDNTVNSGTASYAAGYFTPAPVFASSLNQRPEDFFCNERVPKLAGAGDPFSTPAGANVATFLPLQYSKFACCGSIKETKLSDVIWALGWNFFQDCDYHLGLNIRGSFPTGTRPEGIYIFEPVIGNGHHFELGGGLTSHITLWRSDCEDAQFGFYLDANVTHLFKTRQRRSFDLVGKRAGNSRYMLAEKIGTPVTPTSLAGNPTENTATAGNTVLTSQFKNIYSPVANLTTFDVNVSIGVQADVTALFDYTWCGFSWDIGYNFWGRSCEKITIDCDCGNTQLADGRTWALKGDAYVFAYIPLDGLNLPTGSVANQAIALSATESLATIHSGTNVPFATACTAGVTNRNPNVDNVQFAVYNNIADTDVLKVGPGIPIATTVATQQRTSVQAIFLNDASVDINAARTKGLSHKVFTNFSYTWNRNDDCWLPFVGVGGKVEFGSHESSCNSGCSTTTTITTCSTSCNTDCSNCKSFAISEWGVWVKGGISFH